MHDTTPPVTEPVVHVVPITPTLFTWQYRMVVLFGNQTGSQWTLSRGWRIADTLTDIRQWRFANLDGFLKQVGKLVMEASGDSAESVAAAARARHWASGQ